MIVRRGMSEWRYVTASSGPRVSLVIVARSP